MVSARFKPDNSSISFNLLEKKSIHIISNGPVRMDAKCLEKNILFIVVSKLQSIAMTIVKSSILTGYPKHL